MNDEYDIHKTKFPFGPCKRTRTKEKKIVKWKTFCYVFALKFSVFGAEELKKKKKWQIYLKQK